MDPLSLLREFNVNKQLKDVHVDNDKVYFGERYTFSKSILTAYKSQSGKGDFYTLETLLFFLQKKDVSAQDYIKQTREANVPAVNFIDRKLLVQYLDGEIEASAVAHIAEADDVPVNIFAEADTSRNAKRPRSQDLEDEGGPLKVLLSQERQLRNRNTMLLAPNRDFAKVLSILQQVERKSRQFPPGPHHQQQPHAHHHGGSARPPPGHHNSHHPSAQAPHRPSGSRPHAEQPRLAGAIPVKPSGRFERDATQDQLRAMGGEAAFKLSQVVNIYGGGHARGPPAGPGPQPPAAAPAQAPHAAAHAPRPVAAPKGGSKSGLPIILLPAGVSALFTKYNAPIFLERGTFVPSAAAKAASADPPQATITYVSPRDTVSRSYLLLEKLDRKSQDWQRVVGVICQGTKWQFKEWPFKGAATGDLVDTFSRVAGFYFHYADEAVPDAVRSWNVKCMALPRESRHQDVTLRLEFFRQLENHGGARKASAAAR